MTRRRADGPPPAEVPIPDPYEGNARTLPAGRVLSVVLIALLLGAVLNADALLDGAEDKPFGPERDRSVWIWEKVQSVSDVFFINEPRLKLDEALGKENLEGVDVDDLLAGRTEGGDQGTPGDGEQAEGDSDVTTTTTLPDQPPKIRTPTVEEPLRFWVGGDSITQTFGSAMQQVVTQTGVMTPTLDYRVSTGLARPDYFNWPAHFANDIVPTDPEVMVVMFGANDGQGLELEDGTVFRRFEQGWLDEYRRRVAGTMDLLKDPDNDRLVIWVGQPIMGPTSGVHGMDKMNYIYWDEAKKRPWVVYFDSWPFFSDSAGNYADQLPSADGTVQGMRQKDDVHFSTPGGERLAWAVLARMGQLVDLKNSTSVPDPAIAPPPDVAERAELPPAVAEVIGG